MSEDGKTEIDGAASSPTIFFSYSREDRAQAIELICAIAAAGYKVWYDGMLEPGVKYLEKTEEMLTGARAIIVLWSPRSVQSNWVRDEAMVGREENRLVPLSIEGAVPPLGYRQFQVTDFTNWSGQSDAPEFQALLRQLDRLHGRAMGPAPLLPKRLPRPGTFLTSRPTALIGAVALALIALIAVLFVRPGDDFAPRADNSLLVLPFSNQTGNEALDYLPQGISGEIRSALMRNEALSVVAQSTSEAIKTDALSAAEMSKQLGVAFVLDGTLRAAGEEIRLSVELIEGQTGFSRWSESYSASPEALLGLQAGVVDSILQSITLDIGSGDDTLQGEPNIPAAYDQYLRGLNAWRSAASPDEARSSLVHFDEAVRLDPGFANAHATRGLILSWLSSSSSDRGEATRLLEEALSAAQQAIETGPDLAEAHSTLGWVEFFSASQVKAAEVHFERSRALGQGNAAILARYATYAALAGKPRLAEQAIETAIGRDPINPYMHLSRAIVHYYGGAPDAARQAAERALALNQDIGTAWYWVGMAQIEEGEPDTARGSCEQEPNLDARYTCIAIAFSREGAVAEAHVYLGKLTDEYGDSSAFQQALIKAQLGELDAAMDLLQLARSKQDAGLIAIGAEPMLDPLRERSDFSDLLSEMGFDSV